MSFFYLSPVKGDIAVHLLEIIINKRLEYLKSVYEQNSSDYNEYMIEGSLYDNVGHFMLCIVIILAENTNLTQFFLKSETKLFTQRVSTLSAYHLRRFAKKLLQSIKKLDQVPIILFPLQILCQHLILKDLAHHICNLAHSTTCSMYNIQLSFKHCLSYVAKRQIELNNGTAFMPCGKWKYFLTTLYTSCLKFRIAETNLSALKSDPRINELILKIKTKMFPFYNNNNMNILTSKEIDTVSKCFPPCMLNLHMNLRRKHRLSHSQRFCYSLFLKDIGMPVEEAMDFWKAEYRLSPNGSHSCCHNWEKDEKKYVYGIRHMYGLEGARKKYSSVSCQHIQDTDKSCTEGGCPFKSFDSPNMIQLLNENCDKTILSQINELKRRNHYTSACILYLKSNIRNCDNLGFNFTPVKYYMIASKTNTVL